MKITLSLTIALFTPPLFAQGILPDFYGEPNKGSIGFWENRGQVKNEQGQPVQNVSYYSQGAYPRAYFQKNSRFSLVLQHPVGTSPNALIVSHRLDIRPYEAASISPVGNIVKTHYQNFYLPWCGANGIDHVFGYDRVEYPGVYDMIDMVFYSGSAGQKMAFYCWPGSDPNKIKLQLFGQDSLKVDASGYLKVYKQGLWVKLEEAIAYQVGSTNEVIQLGWSAEYSVIDGNNVVALAFDNYNSELPLVLQIGPTPLEAQSPADGLCWGSYYGGSSGEEVFETETDADGNSYLTGYSESDFMTFQDNVGTVLVTMDRSVLLSSFGADHQLNWTVFYGGSGDQSAFALAVKGQPAQVYIGGYTTASDLFPWVQVGAYNDQNGAGTNNSRGFIGKFDDEGIVQWSTYFGGGNEEVLGMDFDTEGRLHLVGECDANYPSQTLAGATSWPSGGAVDFMIARFTEADALQWCTAYGGSGIDQGADIVCHNNGFYVSGYTLSNNIPLVDGGTNAYDQSTNAGGTDNVLLSFTWNAFCNWATYFGGNGWDQPGHNSMVCKPNGAVYLAGRSFSSNLPTLGAGGFLNANGSTNGAGYIASFSATTRALTWSTYLGGGENTGIESLELANDHLFAVGYTSDPTFPIVPVNGVYDQPTLIGANSIIFSNNGKDGLILGFDASTNLAYSSFFGGEQGGLGESIRSASFRQGELFMAGQVTKGFPINQSFPLYNPGAPAYYDDAYDISLTNSQDIFVTVLCTQELTGPVGLSELTSITYTMTAVPLGNDRWNLTGFAPGLQLIQAFDPSGRLVFDERRVVSPSGNVEVDLSQCSTGAYALVVSGDHGRGMVKVAVIR